MKLKFTWLSVLIAVLIMTAGGIISAQESDVTDDDVNEIAGKLYCPVCENIPLDTCGTAACADWRYEIRLQLEAGATEDDVINDFVTRFGDRVVGTPLDPLLRFISVAPPWIISILGVFVVVFFLLRWRRQQNHPELLKNEDLVSDNQSPTDRYQDLLEQDLSG